MSRHTGLCFCTTCRPLLRIVERCVQNNPTRSRLGCARLISGSCSIVSGCKLNQRAFLRVLTCGCVVQFASAYLSSSHLFLEEPQHGSEPQHHENSASDPICEPTRVKTSRDPADSHMTMRIMQKSWIPEPSRELRIMGYRGGRNTSPWTFFQPDSSMVSSWRERVQPSHSPGDAMKRAPSPETPDALLRCRPLGCSWRCPSSGSG